MDCVTLRFTPRKVLRVDQKQKFFRAGKTDGATKILFCPLLVKLLLVFGTNAMQSASDQLLTGPLSASLAWPRE